jgi:hypothetical protein
MIGIEPEIRAGGPGAVSTLPRLSVAMRKSPCVAKSESPLVAS